MIMIKLRIGLRQIKGFNYLYVNIKLDEIIIVLSIYYFGHFNIFESDCFCRGMLTEFW